MKETLIELLNFIFRFRYKRCVECRGKLDLRPFTTHPTLYVCRECADEHGYTEYMASLRR